VLKELNFLKKELKRTDSLQDKDGNKCIHYKERLLRPIDLMFSRGSKIIMGKYLLTKDNKVTGLQGGQLQGRFLNKKGLGTVLHEIQHIIQGIE